MVTLIVESIISLVIDVAIAWNFRFKTHEKFNCSPNTLEQKLKNFVKRKLLSNDSNYDLSAFKLYIYFVYRRHRCYLSIMSHLYGCNIVTLDGKLLDSQKSHI